ncbi:uncharacterized protein [Choristoneura fumiferana]|uniref:uncharacterized protein n=1 Tax=Choristoneura fumiferana TaxID=7141 RepID=UPI003D15628A
MVSSYDPAVFAISETWLIPGSRFRVPGFSCLRHDRDDGYAGAALLIKSSITYSRITLPPIARGINAVAAKIMDFSVLSIYIHDPHSINISDLEHIFSALPGPFLILGDFNCHHLMWGSADYDALACDLVDLMEDKNICLLNDGSPTRRTAPGLNPSAVDLSLCSPQFGTLLSWSVLQDSYGSDHLPILISFPTSFSQPSSPLNTSRYLLSKADWDQFAADLDAAVRKMPTVLPENAPICHDNLIDAFTVAANTNIPPKKRYKARSSPPWWDSECSDMIRQRNEAERAYCGNMSLDNFLAFKKTAALAKQAWKNQIIIPLHKQGKDPLLPSSHRPIALSSCLLKILEHMIKKRLEWNEFLVGVFLDISSAYDNVILSLLRDKLSKLSLPQKLTHFICNFLMERSIEVRHNGSHSTPRLIWQGLPQGSVLSPLLYSLYTHDLDEAVSPFCNILQYADDIALYSSSHSVEVATCNLNQALFYLGEWLAVHGLSLSVPKCSVVPFTRKRSFSPVEVAFNNQLIPKLLYNAIVRSVLDYGSFALEPCSKVALGKLDKIQFQSLRVILGAMKSSPTNALQVEASDPPFSSDGMLLIRQTLFEAHLRNIEISLSWIPSHSGIEGNETADAHAKEAVEIGSLDHSHCYFYDLFSAAKSDLSSTWLRHYESSLLMGHCPIPPLFMRPGGGYCRSYPFKLPDENYFPIQHPPALYS